MEEQKETNKKGLVFVILIIAILLVFMIVILGGALVGFRLFKEGQSSGVEINISTEKKMDENFNPKDDYAFERVLVTFSDSILFGLSKEKIGEVEEICSVLSDFEEIEIKSNYDSPLDIECQVEVKDGKTYVTYSGTATRLDNGETEDIYKEFVFDFVLTDKIKRNP